MIVKTLYPIIRKKHTLIFHLNSEKALENKNSEKAQGKLIYKIPVNLDRADTDFIGRAIQYFDRKKAIADTCADEQKITC